MGDLEGGGCRELEGGALVGGGDAGAHVVAPGEFVAGGAGDPHHDPAARRAHLDREARLRALPEVDRDLVRLGELANLKRWLE
ncbi:hypothetical protein GCM10009665_56940 [Kitasatospora nipponensis]|uniref:Uncharacterized protein n=1 Tax=Kitasatospora nipponensis TaxID=258049 RepID=A0ABN1WS75_9ACTN